jgi:hypothetical protein
MTVQATEVPSYASKPCGTTSAVVASRYASACSCAGFPATATTAPAETVTVSTTVSKPRPTTCNFIRQECGSDGKGSCQYNVVDGQHNFQDYVCAILPSCSYSNLCDSAADCKSGEACVTADNFCSINNCAKLVN